MNLIEQLGGYEVVKGFYERAIKYGFELMEIRDALLEYRKENNIFEEGDLVVLRNHDCHALYVYAVLHSKDFATLSNGESYDFALIKHASDKEIAQGYRDE